MVQPLPAGQAFQPAPNWHSTINFDRVSLKSLADGTITRIVLPARTLKTKPLLPDFQHRIVPPLDDALASEQFCVSI